MRKYTLIITTILISQYFYSCNENNKRPVVDFSNSSTDFDTDLTTAISFQEFFNHETENMEDFRPFFDTLQFKKERYVVLSASKHNYEVLILPTNSNPNIYTFTKNYVYRVERIPYEIKNWSSRYK